MLLTSVIDKTEKEEEIDFQFWAEEVSYLRSMPELLEFVLSSLYGCGTA